MYYKIVAVGEQTGQLEGVLRNLASYNEQSSAAQRKIKQAMTIIIGLGVGFIAFLFSSPSIPASAWSEGNSGG